MYITYINVEEKSTRLKSACIIIPFSLHRKGKKITTELCFDIFFSMKMSTSVELMHVKNICISYSLCRSNKKKDYRTNIKRF